jgi:predicted PurR-regulated permease PerM/protein-disulfide isomerase
MLYVNDRPGNSLDTIGAMKTILAPLILGILFSFFLLPSVTKLEQWRIPRILANLIMIILCIGVLVGLGAVLSFAISGFADDFPGHASALTQSVSKAHTLVNNVTGLSAEVQRAWVEQNVSILELGTSSLASLLSSATNIISILGLTFLYTFFFLYYRSKIKIFFKKLLEGRHEAVFMNTLQKLVRVVPNYLSGVLWVMAILSVVSSFGFWIIGAKNPLFLGILTSLLNIIPYAGPVIGFGLVFIFTLITQGGSVALGAIIIFIVVQFLENNFLTPVITGNSIDINPLTAIIGIIIGGAVWGVLGMLIALPILGMIKIAFDAIPQLEPFGYLLGTAGTENHEISWANLKKCLSRQNNLYLLSMEPHTHKSFFDRYQTFIGMVVCGALIGGGIAVSKLVPLGIQSDIPITQESVREEMIKAAKSVGIAKSDFATCLDSKKHEPSIQDAVTVAQKSGVRGTPTFFVIKRTYGDDDRIVSETQTKIIGAREQSVFEQVIKDGKEPEGQSEYDSTYGEAITLSDTDHWLGPQRASVIIVEYSDIDCPFCKRAKPIIDDFLAQHPEYAFVYRHSPIASLHPFAEYKAQATECAYELGGGTIAEQKTAFWKFLDIISR